MKLNLILECLRTVQGYDISNHPSIEDKSLHFTFVVQDNEILGVGYNRPESRISQDYPGYMRLHSEADAWRRTKRRLKPWKWEIFNIRIHRDKTLADSEPCEFCLKFLKKMGCKKFYFTTDKKRIGKIIL